MTQEHEHNHEHIVAIDENGEEIVFAVIDRFYSEQFDKEYVLFAEETDAEEVEVQAAELVATDDGEELVGIETEEEWAVIEARLEEIADEEDEEA